MRLLPIQACALAISLAVAACGNSSSSGMNTLGGSSGSGGAAGSGGTTGSGGQVGRGGAGGSAELAGSGGNPAFGGQPGSGGKAGGGGRAGTGGSVGTGANAGTSGSAGSGANAGTSGSAGTGGNPGTGGDGAGGKAGSGGAAGTTGKAGSGGTTASGGAAGFGGSAGAGGATSSGGSAAPSQICDEPAPWALPTANHVVGNGTAATCTATALAQAVGAGGHVTFDCGDSPVTIAISAAMQIDTATFVDGAGKVSLDGGGASRIFLVNNKLSVRNLRFVKGKAPDDGNGGAISGGWRSNIEVIGCIFEGNTAGVNGGAVAAGTGSTLTVVRSQFRRNQASGGGALYSLWTPLHIVNSEFSDNFNTVNNGGGAIVTDGALDPAYRGQQPSGAYTTGGTIEVCGSRFTTNKAYGGGGAAFFWVYPPDKVIIDRCTVEGNTLGKDDDGKGLAMGGGMRINNGEVVVKGSSFLSNSAATHGGGLSLDCQPTCTITNSTFYGNKATDGFAGAIFGDKLRVSNVTFADNYASGQGGALFGGSDWAFKNTVFVDNQAGTPPRGSTCSAKGTGDHVVQWVTDLSGAGSDPCISGVIAADPKLSPPADNGGPTFTMLPAAGSPLLGAGAHCEPSDQRGQPRPDAACDLGAVEVP